MMIVKQTEPIVSQPVDNQPKHYGMELEPGVFEFRLFPIGAPQPLPDLLKFV